MALNRIPYPLVNGAAMSFSSIVLTIGGVAAPMIAVKDISYDDTLSPVKVMGTSPYPLRRTRGVYEANASLEIYREEFVNWIAQLGPGFKEKSFDINVTYTEENVGTFTDTIVGCRIEGNPSKNTQGGDPLTVPVKLNILHIKWDGKHSTVKVPAGA